ncbi:hypothetical protein AAGG49_21965, partial [Stenotrophomonas maltophilia]|uniref:hypothetical protein n=1 Tax=Stenotrophomonas maltophilia TaxID=40324 RepID=UPI00313CE2C8
MVCFQVFFDVAGPGAATALYIFFGMQCFAFLLVHRLSMAALHVYATPDKVAHVTCVAPLRLRTLGLMCGDG